ncbi:MAG: hypothetical protein MHMPM18_004052 [Marteilia pararefringens]
MFRVAITESMIDGIRNFSTLGLIYLDNDTENWGPITLLLNRRILIKGLKGIVGEIGYAISDKCFEKFKNNFYNLFLVEDESENEAPVAEIFDDLEGPASTNCQKLLIKDELAKFNMLKEKIRSDLKQQDVEFGLEKSEYKFVIRVYKRNLSTHQSENSHI